MKAPSTFRLYLRYLRSLAWEFRWSLGIFWGLVFGVGLLLHLCYHHKELNYAESCWAVFLLIFLEPYLDFPDEWYLQPLFFAVPIVGLGAVADSLVRFGYLLFARKNQLPEWQRMVASLYRGHTIVLGLGKVGYRIVMGLLELGESVVVIERSEEPGPSLLEEVLDRGVPIIRGDGRSAKTFEMAQVRHARAVILTTSDDLTNLDAGLTARDLNPNARIVLRLFDESLAVKVAGAFAMPAISTARVAAPAFIAAATGRRVYQDFQLGDRHLHLVDLTIHPGGQLAGLTVGEIQADRQVNIVMHQGPAGANVNPDHDLLLNGGDSVLVIAPIERLVAMEKLNNGGTKP
jgi:Trk K+ transport system NAD-binding subunit